MNFKELSMNQEANLRELIAEGNKIKKDILDLHTAWPKNEQYPNLYIRYHETDSSFKDRVDQISIKIRKWYNQIMVDVLPLTLYDKDYLYSLFKKTEAAA